MTQRKVLWVLLSSLIVVALGLGACAPAAPAPTPTPTPTPAPKPTPAPAPEKKEAVAPAGPKYGGILNTVWSISPLDFDQAYRTAWQSYTLDITHETSFVIDIMKGPAGTKKHTLKALIDIPPEDMRGLCLEKWEMPKPEVWILRVRKGVRFHDKPPVSGREMTADDVVCSFKRMFTLPGSWLAVVPNRPTRIEAVDKYTVKVEFPKFDATMPFRIFDTIYIIPKEIVWDKDDKETGKLRDWRNACGTGPFMLTDYVPDSTIAFKKNPNYWQQDPFNPGNKLPYIDGIKVKIMPELTTRIAALRTAKIDAMWDVTWDQADSLKKTNPELKYVKYMHRSSYEMNPLCSATPFSDIKVRQALSMAVDRDTMIKDLYRGDAERYQRMYSPHEPDVYVSFEKLPAKVQKVLSYNVAEAKKLLAEAGYPNGFKTSILCTETLKDEAVFIATGWKALGVEAKVDLRDSPTYTSLRYSLTYPGVVLGSYLNQPSTNQGDVLLSGHYSNFSVVKDSWWDETYMRQVGIADYRERTALMREMSVYMLEKCWIVPLPTPHLFVFWQLWLKQWEGAFLAGCYHYFQPFTYAWLEK